MAEARDIHGIAFKHGSVVLLARLVGPDASLLAPSQVAAAQYSIDLLDDTAPDDATPVAGHTAVPVPVHRLLSDSLRLDGAWEIDHEGYNFRHELDVSTQPAFTVAGRCYRIAFQLTPVDGQVILVRFHVHVI